MGSGARVAVISRHHRSALGSGGAALRSRDRSGARRGHLRAACRSHERRDSGHCRKIRRGCRRARGWCVGCSTVWVRGLFALGGLRSSSRGSVSGGGARRPRNAPLRRTAVRGGVNGNAHLVFFTGTAAGRALVERVATIFENILTPSGKHEHHDKVRTTAGYRHSHPTSHISPNNITPSTPLCPGQKRMVSL